VEDEDMNNYNGKRLFGSWYIPDFDKPIGMGSFGAVYELKSYDAKAAVTAVKIISIPRDKGEYAAEVAKVGSDEEQAQNNFRRTKDSLINEVEMMLKVSGFTNCVGCMAYSVEPHEDCFGWDILIQMEKLEGLDSFFRSRGNITNHDIIKLGIDMCKALEACKMNNIVHRDIKPANIMVKQIENNDPIYKLGDFGVARTLNKSGTMSMSGTLNYMAPELMLGEGDLRVDIYSLGMVMYEMLNANRLPFLPDYPKEFSPKDLEKARIGCQKDIKKPEPLYTVGTKLAKVVVKACEYDKDKRYASATEMRKELEAVLEEEKEWPIFSVPPRGPYVHSERRVIVKITGNSAAVKYDGKEHTVEGYTSNALNHNIKVELAPGVKASAVGTRAGSYPMGLTKDSFLISPEDSTLKIEDVFVQDGMLTIEKEPGEKKPTAKTGLIAGGIAAITAIALVCALAFGGKGAEKTQPALASPAATTGQTVVSPALLEATETAAPEESEDRVTVKLTLTPSEDAGYADVQHDQPIVVKRLLRFTDEDNITVSDETGAIEATIPLEVLGVSNDLNSIIRGTLARPLQMYLTKRSGYSYYYDDEKGCLERSDVLSVSVVSAQFAQDSYGMPEELKDPYGDVFTLDPEQPCIMLALSDEGAEKVRVLDEKEGDLTVALDIEMESFLSYPVTYYNADDNYLIVCASSWKEKSVAEAQATAFRIDALNKGYRFSWMLSQEAYWEKTDEVDRAGEYQRDFEEMPEDSALLYFETYTEPEKVTEKDYGNAVLEFKRRLDIVGVPYAIGRGIQNSADIVICTSPEPYNVSMLDLLCKNSFNFYVDSDVVNTYGLSADEMNVVLDEQTNLYSLQVNMTSPEELTTVTNDLFKYCKDRHIYLGDYGRNFAAAPVKQLITDGRLNFSELPIALLDEVDEEHKYILELIKRANDAGYPSVRYSLKNYTLPENTGFGLSMLTEEEQAIPDAIKEAYPSTDAWIVEESKANLYIELNTERTSGFLDTAFDTTEEIFRKFDLDNKSFNMVFFIIMEETDGTRCRLVFSKPWGDDPYMDCTGLCGGDWLDTYFEDFKSEGNSRSFFKQRDFWMQTWG